jgi:mannose-6-phosphate isomerase
MADWGRELPENQLIGESWELVDRPEACNPISYPTFADSLTIHDLWQEERITFFGKKALLTPRFPILIKLLDCREILSLQVHPPAKIAKQLGGEPKTELWYFLDTEQDAVIYAGLSRSINQEEFRDALGTNRIWNLLHCLKTTPGDAMFLPSGRLHAIGAGNLILEIQQNSDTTYRVDDWQRTDEHGNRRELHIKEAMQCIQFDDIMPYFVQPHGDTIINCPYFKVQRHWLLKHESILFSPKEESFYFQFVSRGEAKISSANGQVCRRGDAWLVPANQSEISLEAISEDFEIITVSWGD